MNNRGFTLIEIIFSIAFLSVVSVVMLSLLATSFEVENETDMMDIAILHLSNEIEMVKAIEIGDDMMIVKYFNDSWKEVKDNDATFILTVDVEKNNMYDRGLYDIHGQVEMIDQEDLILEIDTKHYYERK